MIRREGRAREMCPKASCITNEAPMFEGVGHVVSCWALFWGDRYVSMRHRILCRPR